jgi:hypothetical protein
LDTTDPAPAPIASKEPEKGKRYFGLYLLVGGRKPYTIWNPIYCKDSWRDSHYLSLSLYLSPLNVPKTGFPWSIPPDLARLTTSRPVTTIIFRPVQGVSTRTPPNSRTSSPEGGGLCVRGSTLCSQTRPMILCITVTPRPLPPGTWPKASPMVSAMFSHSPSPTHRV